MHALAVIVGTVMVLTVLMDMVNTLVTTTTSRARWWLTAVLYTRSWQFVRGLGRRIRSDRKRERLFAAFAPVSVLGLLCAWVVQQVVGFGLIWWGLGATAGRAVGSGHVARDVS